MKEKRQIITETIVAPTTRNMESGSNVDMRAFPELNKKIDEGFIITSLTITAFSYDFGEPDGVVPQLNIVAFLEPLPDTGSVPDGNESQKKINN